MSSDSTEARLSLLKKRADWAQNINDPHSAADMYMSAGEISKAIEIIASNGWISMLVDVARKMDNTETVHLRFIASHLQQLGAVAQACDVLRKIGDHHALVTLLVDSAAWNEALNLVKEYSEYRQAVYLPYARWLAEEEKFVEAQAG